MKRQFEINGLYLIDASKVSYVGIGEWYGLDIIIDGSKMHIPFKDETSRNEVFRKLLKVTKE